MSKSLEERVDELEMHIAHQNETIETLNDVVSNQAQVLDRLVSAMGQMKDHLLDIQDLVEQTPANQKPPHY
ncbi:Protein SlyX [Pseudovibrio sp. W64]|jgi:SlyX protein|uniref:SlyX protein n=1 Tax=Pseudovibrio ascidiaceicola TaxID=285279 RepID=A0A1I4B9Y5_9HYPH|nr:MULTISPECIES: SlyX family protein [Pseudovibrio]KZK81906.1 Protein SlyX [Pseudovibrio sp. W64]KZK83379.1 Protein SlyX [Pseudovibrio sp. Ad13]KZK86553.1 Protein SlyX [Pseudovibrio sp. Ad46]KZK91969.1 Protein SlyX [Pseudovibrio sp. Ad5]KZK94857.1 Protein SlyX [Pseudovibrio sp. W74]